MSGMMAGTSLVKGTSTQQIFINFIFGFFFGTVGAYIVLRFSNNSVFASNAYLKVLERDGPNSFINLLPDPHGDTHIKVNDENRVSLEESSHFHAHKDKFTIGEDTLSHWMSQRVRILCWVMTNPNNLEKKTVHVKATWAKRCNIVLYVSSEDTDFPTIAVVDHEGREYLWQKTRGAFEYIYKHHLNDADWFLKADDDTYVIVENLRKLVSQYKPDEAIYFGRKFKPYVKQGYMSGGAGYILSRNAVKQLVEKGFPDSKLCRAGTFVGGAEDVEIGKCLMNVGVTAGDSREGDLETFHPFVPQQMIVPNILPKKFWYWSYNFYPAREGPECCSDYSVSFHYVAPNMMYQLEYMVYHMRPFGVGYYTCPADIRSIIGLPEVAPTPNHHAEEQKVQNVVEPKQEENQEQPEQKLEVKGLVDAVSEDKQGDVKDG